MIHQKNSTYTVDNSEELKIKMLNWCKRFNIFCFLDNQGYNIQPSRFECLLGAGQHSFIQASNNDLKSLDDFLRGKEWVFGHLSYELKNWLFPLQTRQQDRVGFPLYFFFEPQVVLAVADGKLTIYADDPGKIYKELMQSENSPAENNNHALDIHQKLDKETYISRVEQLKKHIRRGDCYEINFCQEFYADDAAISPLDVYRQLRSVEKVPFSAFYRLHDKYLLSASPERFLFKQGSKLVAQPMKGTARRKAIKADDEKVKTELQADPKERAENVMIVDLMRNDLSKICDDVIVEELCGVYSFPSVHQMISTVSGKLIKNEFSDLLKACFPMGSMTGAPKKRVLELIDQYELSARGIFSGSVGYFHNGDFDFNVVIRSIMYNAGTRYLSFQAGSGITFYSDAEKEWEECLLKAEGIKKVLTGSTFPCSGREII